MLRKATPPLEDLVEDVMLAHTVRADGCETIPLRRTGFRHRPRPNTAIISEAIKRKMRENLG